jgi:hypothetical protein
MRISNTGLPTMMVPTAETTVTVGDVIIRAALADGAQSVNAVTHFGAVNAADIGAGIAAAATKVIGVAVDAIRTIGSTKFIEVAPAVAAQEFLALPDSSASVPASLTQEKLLSFTGKPVIPTGAQGLIKMTANPGNASPVLPGAVITTGSARQVRELPIRFLSTVTIFN